MIFKSNASRVDGSYIQLSLWAVSGDDSSFSKCLASSLGYSSSLYSITLYSFLACHDLFMFQCTPVWTTGTSGSHTPIDQCFHESSNRIQVSELMLVVLMLEHSTSTLNLQDPCMLLCAYPNYSHGLYFDQRVHWPDNLCALNPPAVSGIDWLRLPI